MNFLAEIHEQPASLRRLLNDQFDHIQNIAHEIKRTKFKYILLAARGTSDNAGIYAKYLFGIQNQIVTALAAPSIFSIYKSPINLKKALVIGVSQSGQSPDIVSVLSAAKELGIPTVAITNSAHSPLAEASNHVIDVMAGKEVAVAASKSYTGELLSIALLSAALCENRQMVADLQKVPRLAEEALAQEGTVQQSVERFYYMNHCGVIARGYDYATACEWSIKLKEVASIIAEAYSAADFLHGPIAIVNEEYPVLAVMPKGETFRPMASVIKKIKQNYNTHLVLITNEKNTNHLGGTIYPLPEDTPEWTSPIISIILGQLFTYHLAKLKGLNTDFPQGLKKITKTI